MANITKMRSELYKLIAGVQLKLTISAEDYFKLLALNPKTKIGSLNRVTLSNAERNNFRMVSVLLLTSWFHKLQFAALLSPN